MSKMSITRALVELKTLDRRITMAINLIASVALVTGKNSPRGYKTVEEFETRSKTNYDSAIGLITRRSAIKGAIVMANAATKVTIAGTEMSIAQAIEKKSSIKYERELLQVISRQQSSALQKFEGLEAEMEQKLQKLLEVNFGKDSKAKPDEFEAISKPFKEANSPKIIDPLDSKNLIDKLEKTISIFESEVDFTLSEANAKTEIEIPD